MTSKNGSEATSQDHGRVFERFIRDSGRLPKAVGSPASNSDAIDIAAHYDEEANLHSSVKVTGDGWIGLADAIRFYEIDRPFRFFVGPWVQARPDLKTIGSVHEIIVTTRTLKRLHGNLTLSEIREMHERYASFPAGPEGKALAKKAADAMLVSSRSRRGLVRLDFKGDDYSQRRLQLAIKLSVLINAAQDDPAYVYGGIQVPTHVRTTGPYHNLLLPLEIESTTRRFRSPEASSQAPMPFLLDPSPAPRSTPDSILKPRAVIRQDDAARQAAVARTDPAQRRLLG